ncbi:hypothetical protein [Methylobacterium persicinum]|uniref:CcoQ/FixQ family Cbb3-type cytochrome c oxidase assembly chaperone n=1 Tax=Methylobacterium persicinum TaxID=374426 RepID=A0ABU0HNG8_9HYPH|nr:hypothetical protein [Methylobacterium persicinum]MDQ0443870.1 hypothetical protein [Methylobacterium persicinum]GJE37561.1 hypothetical protein KHHGKMAE_1620 [Methylobacterium persicinum]
MSYEDAAILAVFTIVFAVVIALLPRGRKADLLERPQAHVLEFDPLILDADGPVLDLEAA